MIDRGLEGGQAWESFLTAGEGVGPLLGVWREEGSARQLEEKPLTQLCFVSPRADSVAWNPHKLLGAGLQCSALLLRDTSVGLPSSQTPSSQPPSPPFLYGALASLSHPEESGSECAPFTLPTETKTL